MTPLVSIVVPVFNVERYLSLCLDSLRQQTLSGIEIIFVDDASTDGSPSLLAAAARQDTRVVVLRHASNRGLSAARNTGLRPARAPWVLFIDSDDLVSCHLCERVLAAAERLVSDAVFFGYAVFGDGQQTPPEPAPTAAVPASRVALLRGPAFAWTKLVRTDLMRTNGIEFPEGLCFEDIPVHWRLALESVRPAFLDEALVWYRQRRGSITYRTDWSRADSILIYDRIKNYLHDTGHWEEWKDVFLAQELANFACTHAYYTLANPALTRRVREETIARMTADHWSVVLQGKSLSRGARDYILSRCRPEGMYASPALLLPMLRHGLRDSLRCSWHRVRHAFSV
ncbi:MAG: glycosyltransferase family 2 protein [Verrucomicrobiota bacterium]|jgi:glycosyltransferase involved in cell wall biosynthesis